MMREGEWLRGRPLEEPREDEVELSDDDLEQVVGGLTRIWSEDAQLPRYAAQLPLVPALGGPGEAV